MKMKKEFLCILLALCLTAVLSACGETGQTQGDQASSASPAGSGTETGAPTDTDTPYVFVTGGVTIAINEDMADVLAALGEPQSYFEAASCAFDGLDKTYTYPGFVITTRPEEADLVNSILLTDDSVTTPEGVYIGCSASDVTAAYGECSGTEEVLSCTKGDCTLNFVLEDDTVISIEYLPA